MKIHRRIPRNSRKLLPTIGMAVCRCIKKPRSMSIQRRRQRHRSSRLQRRPTPSECHTRPMGGGSVERWSAAPAAPTGSPNNPKFLEQIAFHAASPDLATPGRLRGMPVYAQHTFLCFVASRQVISHLARSSSRMMSPTAGTSIWPEYGFLMLMTGVRIVACTSLFSKARSASYILQSIRRRPLQ